MGGEDKGRKRPVGSERSLGWLTQSAVQPKKRKEIEGVSAASLMALKSQVAKTQQEAVDVREGVLSADELRLRRRGGGGMATVLERANTGVAERDRVDRLEIKTDGDRLADSRAALERKAALYDRLTAGEMLDDDAADRYEVDFLMKGSAGGSRGGAGAVDTSELAAGGGGGGLMSADMARERERRAWEAEAEAEVGGEGTAAAAAERRRELISEIEVETREGRERAAAARRERQAAEARKRERLKAEFLRHKLEAARAEKKERPGGGAAR